LVQNTGRGFEKGRGIVVMKQMKLSLVLIGVLLFCCLSVQAIVVSKIRLRAGEGEKL